jgi:site-specific recombinase XerD
VRGLRLETCQPKSLGSKYVCRLLRQVRKGGSKWDEALVELLSGTGLRVSELLALRRGDLTLGRGNGEMTVPG